MALEFNEANFNSLLADRDSLAARIKSLNDEAKGHRLSAESFRTQADEFRTKFTESASAIEDLKKLHSTELDKLKLEHGAKLTAAEKLAADTKAEADTRVRNVNLKVIAGQKGLLDIEFLKLLDNSKLKSDDSGEITNADEIFDAWKAEKPHLFGDPAKSGTKTGTTTQTKPPPCASPDNKVDAMKMSDQEFAAALKAIK